MKNIHDQTYSPNPFNGIYNPAAEMLYESGYRIMPDVPPIADGYQRMSITAIEGDGVHGQWLVVDRLASEVAEESRLADISANLTRYTLQNQYLSLCDQLTGKTTHEKLGFAELEAIIASLMDSAPDQAVALSLKLLTLNAALVREGGVAWWDNCEWKELP